MAVLDVPAFVADEEQQLGLAEGVDERRVDDDGGVVGAAQRPRRSDVGGGRQVDRWGRDLQLCWRHHHANERHRYAKPR